MSDVSTGESKWSVGSKSGEMWIFVDDGSVHVQEAQLDCNSLLSQFNAIEKVFHSL